MRCAKQLLKELHLRLVHVYLMFIMEKYGEFHIELLGLMALESWIEDSSWSNILVQANMTTQGAVKQSLLKRSNGICVT